MTDGRHAPPLAGRTAVPVTADGLLISMLGSPASAGLARTLIDQRMCKWDCLHIRDDALLIATELIANAAEATPNKEIRLHFGRDAQGVVIAVWDSSPRLPAPRPRVELTLETLDLSEDSFDDNGGHGLHIVQSLAANCGCTPVPAGGKWTWARLTP